MKLHGIYAWLVKQWSPSNQDRTPSLEEISVKKDQYGPVDPAGFAVQMTFGFTERIASRLDHITIVAPSLDAGSAYVEGGQLVIWAVLNVQWPTWSYNFHSQG